MPRFPLVRALIALFAVFICFSWTGPAFAQDAGVPKKPVFSASDGGAPPTPIAPAPRGNGGADGGSTATPGADGGATATPRADGGVSCDDLGEPGGQRTPANEEVIPRPLQLPPTEAEQARNQSIAHIEIVGNRRVSKDDFLTYLREHVGQPFTPEALTRDVRELWDSGFFDDVQVEI